MSTPPPSRRSFLAGTVGAIAAGQARALRSLFAAEPAADQPLTTLRVRSSPVMQVKRPSSVDAITARDKDGFPTGPVFIRDESGTIIGKIQMLPKPRYSDRDVAALPRNIARLQTPYGAPVRGFRVSEIAGGRETPLFDIDIYEMQNAYMARPTPLDFSHDPKEAVPARGTGAPGVVWFSREDSNVYILFNARKRAGDEPTAQFMSGRVPISGGSFRADISNFPSENDRGLGKKTGTRLEGNNGVISIQPPGKGESAIFPAEAAMVQVLLGAQRLIPEAGRRRVPG